MVDHPHLSANEIAQQDAISLKDDFVPTMPSRVSADVSLWEKIRRARRNLLESWTDDCFKWERFDFTIWNQRYVVCNHPRHVRRVFLDNHDNYDRKSPQMRQALEPLLGDGLFVSDGALWRERRQRCAPTLHADLLPRFVPTMVSTCLELAKRWDERLGCEVDVLAEMGRLTARIIGRTIFGDDTTAAEAEQVVSGFARYQRSIEQLDYGTTSGVPALQALSRFLGAGVDTAAARDVHQVIDRIIGRHRTKRVSSDGANLLNQFLSETSSKEALVCPMSSAAVRNEAIVMFMAGHETTANTLAWVFYVIAAAPQFGAMLREELQRVLGHRLPSYEDVERLPLTRAIIEETLRLYPPVPLLSRQARGPDKLGKLDIRSGDIMLVVPWLLHRHELYWDGPNAFRPERFLPGAPRPDRYCYLPFSGGHRVCLGQRFGLTETILCLAILAQRFKWTLRSEHRVEVECRLTLRPAGGLPMRIDLVQP